MDDCPPLRPAEYAEKLLIERILDGLYPLNATLPAERELAKAFGVTRPTLREALQRLARDGWLEIRQGKPTRVRNFWQEGSLGVLGALARHPAHQPARFVRQLLEVRLVIAPAYAALAVEHHPDAVARLLEDAAALPSTPAAYARYDWRLHHQLSILSDNPVYALIVNGFEDLYIAMATGYFENESTRARSQAFYQNLRLAAIHCAPSEAHAVTHAAMRESLDGF